MGEEEGHGMGFSSEALIGNFIKKGYKVIVLTATRENN